MEAYRGGYEGGKVIECVGKGLGGGIGWCNFHGYDSCRCRPIHSSHLIRIRAKNNLFSVSNLP